MKLKQLIGWQHRAVIVDAERVIAITENTPRRRYPTPGNHADFVEEPSCTIYIDGESCSGENGQGFVVIGTLDDTVSKLNLSLS